VMSLRERRGKVGFSLGWAPTQADGDEGMRKYGFRHGADRISYNFEHGAQNFRHDGTIGEKYNAMTRSRKTTVKGGLTNSMLWIWLTKACFWYFRAIFRRQWRKAGGKNK